VWFPSFFLLLLRLCCADCMHSCAGPLPSIFGLNIATYILCELAEKPILNPLPIKNRRKLYERLLRDLKDRESKITKTDIKSVLNLPLSLVINLDLMKQKFQITVNCQSMKTTFLSSSKIYTWADQSSHLTQYHQDQSSYDGIQISWWWWRIVS
jgi:hypothetical protein